MPSFRGYTRLLFPRLTLPLNPSPSIRNLTGTDSVGMWTDPQVGKHITSLGGVSPSVSSRATHLFVSNNSLESLRGLERFSGVTCLSLTHNLIHRSNDLHPLASLARLETLSLEGNPVCSTPNYRAHVIALASPCLKTLDRREVRSHQAKGIAIYEPLKYWQVFLGWWYETVRVVSIPHRPLYAKTAERPCRIWTRGHDLVPYYAVRCTHGRLFPLVKVTTAEATEAPAIVAAERSLVDKTSRQRCRCIVLDHMSGLFECHAQLREALLTSWSDGLSRLQQRPEAVASVGMGCTGRVWRQRPTLTTPVHQARSMRMQGAGIPVHPRRFDYKYSGGVP